MTSDIGKSQQQMGATNSISLGFVRSLINSYCFEGGTYFICKIAALIAELKIAISLSLSIKRHLSVLKVQAVHLVPWLLDCKYFWDL